MLTIRAMSDGGSYCANHLQANDYYSENERVTGQWFGQGAERLGLTGEVSLEDFESVRQGCDPQTKERLRQRRSADRHDPDGAVRSEGRSLYDFTFSAPKSVSLMAVLGKDDRLVEAHRQAVTEALAELEKLAATRVRTLGQNDDRVTGNVVIARYEHDCSRRLDPQLHSHCVAGNLTFDEIEQRWKALQAGDIYKCRSYLTEVYRNSLARQVLDLGYQIVNRPNERGRDMGFEIVGVGPELIDSFSQGTKAREAAVERFTGDRGRKPTDNEVAVLVADSRPEKLDELSTADVRARQRERLTPEGQAQLDAVWYQASENVDKPTPHYWTESARSVAYALEHTFSRRSVCKDIDLLTEALRHGRGHVAVEMVKAAVDVQEAAGNVLRAGKELATQESLAREERMIAAIAQGVGKFEALGTVQPLYRSLNQSQQEVLKAVLDNRDFAVNIQGAAGTGKTQLLGELRHQLAANGHNFLAVAPTNSAVEELDNVGYDDALTIKALQGSKEAQAMLKGGVLLIDEAGMISAKQMESLIDIARRAGARILFSGDTHQIHSVEAGDALHILEKHSPLQSVALTKVQRQLDPAYRDAVETLREDPAKGLDKLAAIGAIHEVGYLDRPRAVAEAYLASGPDALLACTTHEEIARVTHEVRRLRKQSGQLTDAHAGERYVPLNWTDAQKDEMANYRPGHVLVFHKPTVNTQNHEAVEITRVDKNAIWGRREDGKEIKLTAKQAGAFTVHAKEDIEVASGDVLLLQSSWHGELRFTNGERVTVASIDSNGNKTLTDGRVLPARYKQFNHGYAVTIHVAQGKTVDHVIVAADEMPTELFYVGTTRGRYRCEVYTGDLETLRDSVVQSDARNSATDLAMRLRARSVAQQAQEFYGQPDLHRDAEQSRASTPVHTAEANHAELEAVLD